MLLIRMTLIAIFLASLIFFFAVFIQALTGFGLALLAVPFFILLYDPKVVVPVVMIVGAVLSVMLFYESYRLMKPKQIFYLSLGGITGLPVGVSILAKADSGSLRICIGILIILFAILLSLGVSKKFKEERLTSVGVGFISGVFGGMASMVGPPIILFGLNQNWDKQSFRANLIGYNAFILFFSLFFFGRFGLLTGFTIKLSVSVFPALLLGFIGGVKLKKRVSQQFFRRLAFGIVFVGAVLALMSGFFL